jgi:hypothetical protein
MTRISAETEISVLSAVKRIYDSRHAYETVINRNDIITELLENSRAYPGIRFDNINRIRRVVTTVCSEHFDSLSTNWRVGAWVVCGVFD